MKKILVVIVTYNGRKWMQSCLSSLINSSVPADVFVIDNGSTDGTQDLVRTILPSAHLVCAEENLGFGRANNLGLSYAMENGYDFVYLLNQDAWVFPDTFAKLLDAFESDSRYGVLSPVQMAASMKNQDPRFERWAPKEVKSLSDKGVISIVEPPFVMAAHWMISRKCLEKVGGFSLAFRHYGEDDNYLNRVRWHGLKFGIVTSVYAVHDREMRKSTKQMKMRLKCVASLVKLSNPCNNLIFRMIAQPLELMAISLMYLSWDVFRYMFSFLGSYSEILKYRKESMSDGAFLK